MWRNTVIKSHHLYVEPGKYVADLIVPWGEQHNLLAIKAVAGAIEYEAYLKRHIRKTKK
jgi:uridine kinase